MNTKQMERHVKVQTLTTLFIVSITMALSVTVPELLIKFTVVDSPMLLRIGMYLIMFSILGMCLKRINCKFINRYNDELETRAYTTEQIFRNQQIITEEEYHTIKELIIDYEASHKEDK